MISNLINSNRPNKAHACRSIYVGLMAGRAHEVILYPNARSMRGRCTGHEEVLDRGQFDVMGAAGTDELVHPVWTGAGMGLFG